MGLRGLFKWSAKTAGGRTEVAVDLAYTSLGAVRKSGDLSIDLVETVVLQHAWHKVLASISVVDIFGGVAGGGGLARGRSARGA